MPALIYGTAWKKERTRDLVRHALLAGFKGVDTAAQPKHYQENLVGLGINDARGDAGIRREEIYLQTKFTSIHGQDPTQMPYDPKSSIVDQVNASVDSSLRNLGPSPEALGEAGYIDCLVLHSPFPSQRQTEEAWRAMESHVPHTVRTLGISNIYHLPALQALYEAAAVKPSVVQNRFYSNTGYDAAIRSFCTEKDIAYQSFWTLTANPQLLRSQAVGVVAETLGVSRPVAMYGLVLGLGNVSILNGTTNTQRMTDDLEGLKTIKAWSQADPDKWAEVQKAFNAMLEV